MVGVAQRRRTAPDLAAYGRWQRAGDDDACLTRLKVPPQRAEVVEQTAGRDHDRIRRDDAAGRLHVDRLSSGADAANGRLVVNDGALRGRGCRETDARPIRIDRVALHTN